MTVQATLDDADYIPLEEKLIAKITVGNKCITEMRWVFTGKDKFHLTIVTNATLKNLEQALEETFSSYKVLCDIPKWSKGMRTWLVEVSF